MCILLVGEIKDEDVCLWWIKYIYIIIYILFLFVNGKWCNNIV